MTTKKIKSEVKEKKTVSRKKKTDVSPVADVQHNADAGRAAEKLPKEKKALTHKKTAVKKKVSTETSASDNSSKTVKKTRSIKTKKIVADEKTVVQAAVPVKPIASGAQNSEHKSQPIHAPVIEKKHSPEHKPKEPAKPLSEQVLHAHAQARAPEISKPKPEAKPEPVKIYKGIIKINETVTIRDLAEKMNQKPADLIKKLISMGTLATINQRINTDIAAIIAHEFNFDVKTVPLYAEEDALVEQKEDPAKLKPRSPVVTIMGHVDHGKTSLLDAIRKSRVAEGEAGGITQHIGAYKVKTPKGEIAFLDTPGHEAFTAMRARGAQATDIVILVVSATDGIMPQTVEAIDHAKAAKVPIIVAINKIDLPTANSQQIKQELSKYDLLPEDWGGDTITVEVSAKKNINIDLLLEMILLKAEIMELKSNPDKMARGVVIEAKLDPRRGPVATVLIHSGTLRVGDNFVAGITSGKIRAMINDHGHRLIEAGPSTPVEILGITNPPQAGDPFIVVKDDREARDISISRQTIAREEALRPRHHLSLEDISAGKVKELRVIIKADVRGSLEALRDSLDKLSTSSINLNLVHSGVGSINESDITLAAASDALIIAFNLRPDSNTQKLADHEGVSIRTYRIIYETINEVKAAMEGLLDPELKEMIIGKSVVKQVFKVTKGGMIAGSMVIEGKIARSAKARILRDNVIVFEGGISNLKRFKDDVREVEKGFECGISIEKFQDIRPGDILEFFTQEKIARKLENS